MTGIDEGWPEGWVPLQDRPLPEKEFVNDFMTRKQLDAGVEHFEQVIRDLKTGRVKWWAVSVKFLNDSSYALHSEHAPKRPQGIT